MSQELTDAEWLRNFVSLYSGMEDEDIAILLIDDIARLRAIAARLERPAVEGALMKYGDGYVVDIDDSAAVVEERTGLVVANDVGLLRVTVTINPAGPGGRE